MVINVREVSVRYLTGGFKDMGIKEYVVRHLCGTYSVKEFWAIEKVSFSLAKGDILGIIGSNGAGKSTLLKVIAGILVPTAGQTDVNGSIAALLELQSGFDDELTVKENTYLRGALLGFTRRFIDAKYPEIIAFAELEDFEDYTVRRLSSGMKARLAFAISCMVDPGVLILDEILSVGDGAFQKKSEAKIMDIINRGVTTILVSHSLDQIRRICNKTLWLDKGRKIAFGDVTDICDRYEAFLNENRNEP